MAVAATENPLVEGLERLPVPPTTLVIFGATGDLCRRKLLPALYNLAHEGALPERFNMIGVSRRDQSDDEFRDLARESVQQFSRRTPDDQVLDGLVRFAVDLRLSPLRSRLVAGLAGLSTSSRIFARIGASRL